MQFESWFVTKNSCRYVDACLDFEVISLIEARYDR